MLNLRSNLNYGRKVLKNGIDWISEKTFRI